MELLLYGQVIAVNKSVTICLLLLRAGSLVLADGCREEFDEANCAYDNTCTGYIALDHQVRFQFNDPQGLCPRIYHRNGNTHNKINIIFRKNLYDQGDINSIFREDYDAQAVQSLDLSNNDYNTQITREMQSLIKLNMSRNSLTEVKLSNQHEMDSLTEIDFSYNFINTIEVNVLEHSYKNLVKLNVSHNYLVSVPEAVFDTFGELETLDLSYNYIDTLSIMTFEGIKKLMYLYLSNNRISDISSSLFRFNELIELDLNNNRLQSIKVRNFEKLKNLEKLDLHSNGILDIEANVFDNMVMLNFLDLSNNALESISKEMFYNVSNLKDVNLSKNNLKTLPKDLFKGKNVSIISIKGNILQGSLVRGNFEGLRLVTELNLSNQQLASVEDFAFFGLEKLETLLLNNNIINSLSKQCFKSLQNLNHLDLSHNKLKNIEFDKEDLFSLRSLLLRNNYLTEVKYEYFKSLNMLQFLDLSDNKISMLQSNSFKSLRDLINFQISNNPISGTLEESSFDGLNSLPILDISKTLLTTIKNQSFSGMVQLKDLNVSHSNISELQFNCFSHTGAIETIDLSFNQLTDFCVNTSGLITLTSLFLNNNLLSVISPGSLKGLSRLMKLILSFNSIETVFNEAFYDQADLRYLDLSFNQELKFSVLQIEKNSNMESLFLSGIKTNITFRNIEPAPFSQLEISCAGIHNITELELNKLKNLGDLVLNNNEITRIEVGAFYNVTSLRKLDLSFNKIKFIQPGSFKDNSLLVVLNISHNLLKSISYGIFRGLIYLHTIDMSFNEIDNLESERFYEVIGLSVLIADHNKIYSVNADDFAGNSLSKLSIGDNPLPCDILVNLKKSNIRFAVTALRLDESNDENVDGVTCNIGSSKANIKPTSGNFVQNDKLLVDIRDILLNLSSVKPTEKSIEVANDDSQYLTNITRLIENSGVEYKKAQSNLNNLTSSLVNENKNTNLLLDRMLKMLTAINSIKRSTTQVPIPKENATVENLIPYINRIKQELEDSIALEKQNILNEIDTKISSKDAYKETLVMATSSPNHEALSTSDADSKSFIFIETGVALILVILIVFILYKFYNSGMFVPTRRSYSTRHLPDAIENSAL